MPTPEARRRRRRMRLSLRIRKLTTNKPLVLMLGFGFATILVLLEYTFDLDFSLGILYIVPVMIVATIMPRWQIVIVAIACAYVRGLFITDKTPLEHTLRFVMAAIAYIGCGLLIYQITESRRVMMGHYARIRFEQKLRRRAEEQLRLMAESSPAAILTIAADGTILAANHAADAIFETDELTGKGIRDLVPFFSEALRLPDDIGGVRTQTNTWARRVDGTQFPAATWFSTYGSGDTKRLAAIVVDVSNEVREREHAHYEDLVQQNRLLAGAVSHEIRNMCAAISVVQRNLERKTDLAGNDDFDAMSKLVDALGQMAHFELKHFQSVTTSVDLHTLVDELRVIIGMDWRDAGGNVEWKIPAGLPLVYADRQGLLQVMLNLSQNALRAVENTDEKRLTIDTREEEEEIILRVADTGSGVSNPSALFQPFRPGEGTGGTGLGLYVSRAIVRSFGGALRYAPVERGCCFEIVLRRVGVDVEVVTA